MPCLGFYGIVDMIDALFGNSSYVATKKLLDATAMRHEAISSNLANVDTPGYKRIDVDSTFESQLKSAVSSQNLQDIQTLQPSLATDTQSIATREDGNTVSLESELLKMNENMVEHSMETQMVSVSLMKLRMAITGKA